jgi:hypothetical protein
VPQAPPFCFFTEQIGPASDSESAQEAPSLMPDSHNARWETRQRSATPLDRTRGPVIKSHVLYHLSYALTCRAV